MRPVTQEGHKVRARIVRKRTDKYLKDRCEHTVLVYFRCSVDACSYLLFTVRSIVQPGAECVELKKVWIAALVLSVSHQATTGELSSCRQGIQGTPPQLPLVTAAVHSPRKALSSNSRSDVHRGRLKVKLIIILRHTRPCCPNYALQTAFLALNTFLKL